MFNGTNWLVHRAGLVENQDDIRGDIHFHLVDDLASGGIGFKCDFISVIINLICFFVDHHTAAGAAAGAAFLSVRRCSRHEQGAEKRQAQQQG